jgi:hypothetical protein
MRRDKGCSSPSFPAFANKLLSTSITKIKSMGDKGPLDAALADSERFLLAHHSLKYGLKKLIAD